MFLSRGDRDLGVAFQTPPGRQEFISSGSNEPRSALESRRVSLISWSSLGGLKGVKPPEAFGERSRGWPLGHARSEEHTSELQSPLNLGCRLLLEKKKNKID